ncbi:MAG: glycosyltransferase family 4 protein [Puia sp.]|nr:glycosyltransferase family 4 protein [Puia sp.]
MEKKRILVLVDWFAPGYKAGGPIQSCVNFAFSLKSLFRILVLTTDTDHGEKEPYQGIVADQWTHSMHPEVGVFYAKKSSMKLRQLKKVMLDSRADYVYLNHLFSPYFVLYPLWLAYTGALKSRIVLCPRGALYLSALSVKPYKKYPFIRLFRFLGIHKRITFHATNEREKEAILHYFPGSRIVVADNLPKSDQPGFASCFKEAGFLKCIFIARIVPIKNLLYLLETLSTVQARVELTIIGPVEDETYWNACRNTIEGLPPNINVQYAGPKRNDELMPVLQQHHLFILPTTGENFGHSIFEALLAGRPVLISDQTPWLGLRDRKTGWDIPLAEPGSFAETIENMARWDQATFDEWARSAWQYARHFIENPELQSRYKELFP